MSPVYAAVILCAPAASEVIVKLAAPLISVPVPRRLLASLNWTVPVAVFGEIVAVN
jgi:hypothetical protein